MGVPIGTGRTGTRVESDSMGEIKVPADAYYGAQTGRAVEVPPKRRPAFRASEALVAALNPPPAGHG